jgi:hypothetical protein
VAVLTDRQTIYVKKLEFTTSRFGKADTMRFKFQEAWPRVLIDDADPIRKYPETLPLRIYARLQISIWLRLQ